MLMCEIIMWTVHLYKCICIVWFVPLYIVCAFEGNGVVCVRLPPTHCEYLYVIGTSLQLFYIMVGESVMIFIRSGIALYVYKRLFLWNSQ